MATQAKISCPKGAFQSFDYQEWTKAKETQPEALA